MGFHSQVKRLLKRILSAMSSRYRLIREGNPRAAWWEVKRHLRRLTLVAEVGLSQVMQLEHIVVIKGPVPFGKMEDSQEGRTAGERRLN